jgi:prepilin-type N-terminal cleavage/methylation domain-containing protein
MSRTAPVRKFLAFAKLRRQRGFALLELLVAFVILALGLSAILTGVAFAMRSDGHTQMTQIMFRLAQSRLEEAGVSEELVAGHREGRIAGNFRWQETITAVHIETRLSAPQNAKPDAKSDTKPAQSGDNRSVVSYWVEVTVQAADGTVARLAALKLASGAPQ